MNLVEYFKLSNISIDLKSKNKSNVLKEMFDLIKNDNNNKIIDDKKCYQDIIKRENLSSTAITNLVAIPHTKTEYVNEIMIAIGLSKEGIEYDNNKVKIIIMFLVPNNKHIEYLRILGMFSRLLAKEEFINKLLSSNSKEDVFNILKEYNEKEEDK